MMSFFIAFVLGSVLMGAGAMLAPAWSGDDNHVGLSTGAILAIVVVGAMAQTRLLDWDTLVIDYIIFGVVSAVILGGTLAGNAHADTEATDDKDTDIFALTITYERIFFLCVFAGFALLLVLGWQQIPIEPSISIDQLPQSNTTIIDLISLYLSAQMRQEILLVQPAVTLTMSFVTVMVAYDVGRVWGNRTIGQIFSAVCLLITLYFVLTGNHFALTQLLLGLTIMGFLRFMQVAHSWQAVILSGVVLGSAIYASNLLFGLGLGLLGILVIVRYREISQMQILSTLGIAGIAILCASPVLFSA
ncbi:MAG: hypothetical protein AAFV98_06865 [Chloroflexota bacterium]